MSRIDLCLLKGRIVVLLATQRIEPSATDVAPNHPVSPLVLRVRKVGLLGIIAVRVLRDEGLTHEDKDQHNCNLEDRLSDDMFEHSRANDVVISGVRFSQEQVRVGVLCCKSDRC